MKIVNDELEKKLRSTRLDPEEMTPDGQPILAKLYHPQAEWTWYILEGFEVAPNNWDFFGLAVSPMETNGSLGYFNSKELEENNVLRNDNFVGTWGDVKKITGYGRRFGGSRGPSNFK